jgi:asparagine synthase (glutamine-hydrolysing)
MCGIVGVLDRSGEAVSPVVIRSMTDQVIHRGPDDSGIFTDRSVGLGHRRLSIIDLSPAGHQPVETPDGRYVMVYNGEVYNFQELRIELGAKGWQFHSNTDSEVVLKAFAHWGTDALNRFNGMFAFAVWDKKEKSLFLARDRYGIKPLYYSWSGNKFLFASEIKAIAAHPSFQSDIDMEGLLEYFTFQNFLSDRTLHKGVKMLPAGCWMQIKLDGSKSPRLNRYWDYNFEEPENPYDDEEYVEELDRLFQQAVKRQLVADVDVGSYLSGGMDSGSITAIAAKELQNMRTFTCGFDMSSASGIELGFDERREAEHMSYLFKTEHYEMVLKAGDMEQALPKLIRHLEEPRVGQSYPNYYAAQLASKFGKVVLSGTGGDEIFGGYPWRYYRAVVNNDFEHYIDKYYDYWQRLIPNRQIKKVFAPIWDEVKHVSTRDIFRDVFATHSKHLSRPEDYVNHSLYFEAKTFLHGLLVVEDKISMAHSLETRVPFLDNDLVDFAMKVPTRLKLGHLSDVVRINENEPGSKTAKYFQKTKDGKLLLRKMMQRHVPQEVSEREKQGFSGPDASWFKGESIDYVNRKICHDNAKIYQYMDRKAVQKLIDDHLDGRENRRLLIWSLINTEKWCECFGGTSNADS